MTDSNKFLQTINGNYDALKRKMIAYCLGTKQQFDEDVFSQTIITCHDTIDRHGLKDNTENGCINYFFQAFSRNIKREKQYSRNSKKTSIEAEKLMSTYEEWNNNTNLTLDEKLLQDVYRDFATIYIMKAVEANFPHNDYNLFNLKYVGANTFKQLGQLTGEKAIRQRVTAIKEWVKHNVTKDEVSKAFDEFLMHSFLK